MLKRWLLPALGTAVVVVAVWAGLQARQAEEGFLDTRNASVAGPVQHALIGQAAPSARLAAPGGDAAPLVTAGKPAVVVYWTTW